MKRYIPFVILFLGILVAVGAYFFVIRKPEADTDKPLFEDLTALIDVPLEKRPYTTLSPSADGHWLKLNISRFDVEGAQSMDYELLYKLPDGRTQGVPGNIKLNGQNEIERDLLLGSESSGKFRYDEGVTSGTLSLRFRNKKGKLLAKFSTDFNLLSDEIILESADGFFSFVLDEAQDGFFVVMETFGLPGELSETVNSGPYGVFSSLKKGPFSGTVNLTSAKHWSESAWSDLDNGGVIDIGVFVGI